MIQNQEHFANHRILTAFHEAGHAAATLHFGHKVRSVDVVDRERYNVAGQCNGYEDDVWEKPEEMVTVLAAGNVAQIMCEVVLLMEPELQSEWRRFFSKNFNASKFERLSKPFKLIGPLHPDTSSPSDAQIIDAIFEQHDAKLVANLKLTGEVETSRIPLVRDKNRRDRISQDAAIELLRDPRVWGVVWDIAAALICEIYLDGDHVDTIAARAKPCVPPDFLTSRELFIKNWLRPLPAPLTTDDIRIIAAAAVEHGAEEEFAAFLKGGESNGQ